MKKVLAFLLVVLVVVVPIVSATYYKKAIFEVEDDMWEVEQDENYQTISSNNGNMLALAFENSGTWLWRKGITFICTAETLSYQTGWWLWKEQGTIDEVEDGVGIEAEFIYEEQKIWHISLWDDVELQFFYYRYNESWADINISSLSNITINIAIFGGGNEVIGCMYTTETALVTVKEAGWIDYLKYASSVPEED